MKKDVTQRFARMTVGIGFGVCSVVIALGAAGLVPEAQAEVADLVRYQGTATDSGGTALGGAYNLTFRMYNAATGGSASWTETQSGVSIADGQFSVLLGSVTSLDGMDWEQPCWMSVQIGTDPELSPRQRISSVPTAILAEKITTPHFTSNVGIDTTTPAGKISFGSGMGMNKIHLFEIGTTAFGIGTASDEVCLYTDPHPSSRIAFGTRSTDGSATWTENMRMTSDGKLQIGAAVPDNYKLYVNGDAYSTGVWYGSSRERKRDIQAVPASQYSLLLSELDRMNLVEFNWKDNQNTDERRHLGLIAEELPDVLTNKTKTAVSVSDYLAFITASVKALKLQNDALKARVQVLERGKR